MLSKLSLFVWHTFTHLNSVPCCLCFANPVEICSRLSDHTRGSCASQNGSTARVGRQGHRGLLIVILNVHQWYVQECTHHRSTLDIGHENSWTSSVQFWRWCAVILAASEECHGVSVCVFVALDASHQPKHTTLQKLTYHTASSHTRNHRTHPWPHHQAAHKPTHELLQCHINLAFSRPPSCKWKRPPGWSRCRWTDQIRKDKNDLHL